MRQKENTLIYRSVVLLIVTQLLVAGCSQVKTPNNTFFHRGIETIEGQLYLFGRIHRSDSEVPNSPFASTNSSEICWYIEVEGDNNDSYRFELLGDGVGEKNFKELGSGANRKFYIRAEKERGQKSRCGLGEVMTVLEVLEVSYDNDGSQ